jgi:hypothetical protein
MLLPFLFLCGLVVPLWICMHSSWATEKGLNGNVKLYLLLIVTRVWGSAVVLSYATVKLWLDIEWLTVLYNSKYLNHCLRGWLYVPFNADNSKLGWFILQSTVNSSSMQVFPMWIHLFICELVNSYFENGEFDYTQSSKHAVVAYVEHDCCLKGKDTRWENKDSR